MDQVSYPTSLTWGAETTTHHASGSVGEIQGDSNRLHSTGTPTGMYFEDSLSMMFPNIGMYDAFGTNWYPWRQVDIDNHYEAWGVAKDSSPVYSVFFFLNPKHYRYRLSGDPESGYSLEEYTTDAEPDEGARQDVRICGVRGGNIFSMPISNEIRPVNTAVRYFIRAR